MKDSQRRNQLDKCSPVELLIYTTITKVEKMESDVRLTNAIIKLNEARNWIADYIDDVPLVLPNETNN